jgi:hypothetical protein
MTTSPVFIVAEISKNWPEAICTEGHLPPFKDCAACAERETLLSQRFEHVIEVNRRRGYILVSFQLNRMVPQRGQLNETIIAVFERALTREEALE